MAAIGPFVVYSTTDLGLISLVRIPNFSILKKIWACAWAFASTEGSHARKVVDLKRLL